MKVTIADGKYTVVCDEVKGLRALRYGEEWRDLTGDNLVAELALEIEELRAALQSQDRRDAARYRYLIAKLQQAYDGDYFETDLISLYCHMPNQYKGERIVRAEITWRDKTDEPIGLSEAIDHARRIEGES